MDCHISVVDHKTTRLCSLVSSWIDTGEMHKIQWKNTNKIQHKRCKNWTKYKYIDPHSNRYACNRSTESTMGEKSLCGVQMCVDAVGCEEECPPQGPRHCICFPYMVWRIKSVHLRDTLYAPDDAVDMDCHISVVDHKTTRLCIALSAHGSTRAKCIRSNGIIQIRSNTKDTRTGRNTNTSILVATDMHATETLNQQ